MLRRGIPNLVEFREGESTLRWSEKRKNKKKKKKKKKKKGLLDPISAIF